MNTNRLISIFVVSAMLSVVGCVESKSPAEIRETRVKRFIYVQTIEHDGHKWIMVNGSSQHIPTGGIVHHPDCPCKKVE